MAPINFAYVDDDKILHVIIERYLEDCTTPHISKSFYNGKEIRDFLFALESPISMVVLLDINMPIMDGWDFLESLVELDQSFKESLFIYVITSSIDLKDEKRALSYSTVKGFISKPISQEKLLELLELHS